MFSSRILEYLTYGRQRVESEKISVSVFYCDIYHFLAYVCFHHFSFIKSV